MEKRKEFLDTLSAFFLTKGFKKKGNTMSLDTASSVSIVNFQKSSYGDMYYLNFGVFFKDKNQEVKTETLKIEDAHFFTRYDKLLGTKTESIEIPEIEDISGFTQEIILNIDKKIMPYPEDLTSVTYLKTILPKNIPWDKIWLQNIKGDDLLKLVESNL